MELLKKNPGEDKATPGLLGGNGLSRAEFGSWDTSEAEGRPEPQCGTRNQRGGTRGERQTGLTIPSDVGIGREEAASMTQRFAVIHRKRKVSRRSRTGGKNYSSCHQTLLRILVCTVLPQNMLPGHS